MLTPEYAKVIVDQLINLNEDRSRKVLWDELTRRRKEIEERYNTGLTEESLKYIREEEHLIESFKAYNVVMQSKIKLLERAIKEMSERAIREMVKNSKDIPITYEEIRWQSSIIRRLRELKSSIK